MKALFSLAALLVVLGLTGLLVKKQLGTASAPPTIGSPAAGTNGSTTPANQVQQVGKQVESLMQQPRPQSPDQ